MMPHLSPGPLAGGPSLPHSAAEVIDLTMYRAVRIALDAGISPEVIEADLGHVSVPCYACAGSRTDGRGRPCRRCGGSGWEPK